MSGFFKKVASAFVVIEETPGAPPAKSGPKLDLDSIGSDASELLAQLEAPRNAPRPSATGSSMPTPPRANAPLQAKTAPPAPDLSPSSVPSAPPANTPVSAMTADDVFLSAGLQDTSTSAIRILRMLAGLSMFPPEQQRVMLRAMDQADPTWSEPEVLSDAQQRLAALRQHLDRIEGERQSRLDGLESSIRDARAAGDAMISEFDAQIAELQKLKNDAIQETATALAGLEAQKREADAVATDARSRLEAVRQSLEGLVNFLAGPSSASAGQPLAGLRR